ncbi:uncharacterized protein LOC133471997 isoform X3 [Phyllopteryx taeniolatus]|uniref:uncharacterized protein LOC133471997 isoform X3 n=1 Tax=Phyllopteryx taeniolatus TaxID=161469 RepID=UPI002AD3F9E9|nr:uncharacterized protein LOC133471997 isoform X3 [Phyllopteryx taeniolatus]
MNWLGGSRNRLMMKNDTKKQREFFEKMKMQNKLKNLEATPPEVSSFASMDLVTLFVANQIAAKKEHKDPPPVAVLGSKRGGKKRGVNPLILPMSPGSPSQLSLVESQPQCSVQSERTRQIVPQSFKIWQSSNKAMFGNGEKKTSHMTLSPVVECCSSDNSAADYLPPIAGTLSPFSSSPSTSGHAGSQPLPGWPPSPWETSDLDQITFQPFCAPGGMAEDSWSSNPATSSAAFFGTPDAATEHPIFQDTFLSQVSLIEPTLDFNLNQTGSQQLFEEDIFKGFIVDESETDAFHFGSEKTKIYLKHEASVQASTPQTVPEPQAFEVQLPNWSMNFSACPEYPMSGWGSSPTSSFKRGHLSSSSSDSEECCHPLGFSPMQAPANSPEFCACQKAPSERTDAETQTIHGSTLKTCDVATQCTLVSDPSPPVNVSLQQEATGGHTGCTEAPVEGRAKSGRRPTLWRKKKFNSLSILNLTLRRKSRMSSQILQNILRKVSKGSCHSPWKKPAQMERGWTMPPPPWRRGKLSRK